MEFVKGTPEFWDVYFLPAYIVFGIILLVVIWRHQRIHEPGPPTGPLLSDPYMIAFLRGENTIFLPARQVSVFKFEFLFTVIISLVDRRLLYPNLKRQGLTYFFYARRAETIPPDAFKKPIEQAVIQQFSTSRSRSFHSVYNDEFVNNENSSLSRIVRWHESSLEQLGLLPGSRVYAARLTRCLLGGVVLWSFPVMEGLDWLPFRGSVLPATFFTFFLGYMFMLARTPRGDAMLAALQRQYAHLRKRAYMLRPHQSPDEVLLTAALFGPRSLPKEHFPYVRKIF